MIAVTSRAPVREHFHVKYYFKVHLKKLLF